MNTLNIKTGDTVIVLSGKDKGKKGKVLSVDPEARKVIVSRPDINDSAADVLAEPIVVCRAHGTCVTPKDCQRKK